MTDSKVSATIVIISMLCMATILGSALAIVTTMDGGDKNSTVTLRCTSLEEDHWEAFSKYITEEESDWTVSTTDVCISTEKYRSKQTTEEAAADIESIIADFCIEFGLNYELSEYFDEEAKLGESFTFWMVSLTEYPNVTAQFGESMPDADWSSLKNVLSEGWGYDDGSKSIKTNKYPYGTTAASILTEVFAMLEYAGLAATDYDVDAGVVKTVVREDTTLSFGTAGAPVVKLDCKNVDDEYYQKMKAAMADWTADDTEKSLLTRTHYKTGDAFETIATEVNEIIKKLGLDCSVTRDYDGTATLEKAAQFTIGKNTNVVVEYYMDGYYGALKLAGLKGWTIDESKYTFTSVNEKYNEMDLLSTAIEDFKEAFTQAGFIYDNTPIIDTVDSNDRIGSERILTLGSSSKPFVKIDCTFDTQGKIIIPYMPDPWIIIDMGTKKLAYATTIGSITLVNLEPTTKISDIWSFFNSNFGTTIANGYNFNTISKETLGCGCVCVVSEQYHPEMKIDCSAMSSDEFDSFAAYLDCDKWSVWDKDKKIIVTTQYKRDVPMCGIFDEMKKTIDIWAYQEDLSGKFMIDETEFSPWAEMKEVRKMTIITA